MVSRQTLLEACGVLLFFVAVPSLLVWLFDPVIRFAKNSTSTNQVTVSYFINGVECDMQCMAADRRKHRNEPQVDLTVVIPAYNEEKRLPAMLEETLDYLQKWSLEQKVTYEILVSDDSSVDGTAQYVRQEAARNQHIRLISLSKNCGKGGAVKRGVHYSRGRYVLMADADGATDINDLSKLWNSLHMVEETSSSGDVMGIAIGSRAHLEQESVATRSLVRTVLMRGFHVLVTLLCTKNIKDTQCGFKLFTRRAARLLFSNLHLEGWTFDIEIIMLAEKLFIPISEVAVNWHEVDGSKLIQNRFDVVFTSLKMARDMLCLRLSYIIGLWAINPKL